MALITDLVLTPIILGLLAILLRKISRWIALFASALAVYYSIKLLSLGAGTYLLSISTPIPIIFHTDFLSGSLAIAISVLTFLVVLFSINRLPNRFFTYIPLALGISLGILLAQHLFLFFFFWSFLLAIVFGILMVGKKDLDSSRAAQKALFILGVSDFAMLLGIVLLITTVGISSLTPELPALLNSPVAITAFILILAGAIGKIGAFPFHTWIPTASDVVPASTMAFLPSILDKILGTYLLIRLLTAVFKVNQSMSLLLMIIGSITIIIGVFMALIQKNAMRTLAYSTIGQAGYIVLGLGTLHPIGIAGALFHTINNTIYKTSLFFTLGSVENRTGKLDLEDLGGLARSMPITFFAFLISVLALAGVPPLSGFFSKWMIYQAVIKTRFHWLWPFFLIAAMFGSVITLAYSLKLLHSIFLSEKPKWLDIDKIKETTINSWLPALILAIGAIVFGVFAYQLPIQRFVLKALTSPITSVPGFWQPITATILILIGLLVGLFIYLLGTGLRPKDSKSFIGGEELELEETRISGNHLYSSIQNIYMINKIYKFGSGGAFDIYNYLLAIFKGLGIVAGKVIDFLIKEIYTIVASLHYISGTVSSKEHKGILPIYLGWILLGLVLFLLFLM